MNKFIKGDLVKALNTTHPRVGVVIDAESYFSLIEVLWNCGSSQLFSAKSLAIIRGEKV